MALKNLQDNYLKITSFSFIYNDFLGLKLNVSYQLYKDEDSRRNGLSEFEVAPSFSIILPNLNYQFDQNKTDLNNFLSGIYVTMKTLPDFSEWIDVLEE